LQVFDRTFAVFCNVPFVQVPDAPAGEFGTVVTEQTLVSVLLRTGFYTANRAMIRLIACIITADAGMLLPLESQAEITYYTAGSETGVIH